MANDENAKIRPGEKESGQPLATFWACSKWTIAGLMAFHRGDNAQLKGLSGWHVSCLHAGYAQDHHPA